MPLHLRYIAIRFAIRPNQRNAERFERFALLDLDATRRRDAGWFDAFDAYNRARAREPHVKKTMRRLIATQTKPIPDGELDLIDIPTTLLWGRHDRMVPVAIGEAASARHGWPLHVIDEAGHAPHVEQPDAFVETLTDVTTAP
jgi:pimeloyl-ACP methyl ester carboxylesterase